MRVFSKLRNLCMLSNVNIAIGWVLFHNVARLNVTLFVNISTWALHRSSKRNSHEEPLFFHFQSLLAEMYYYGKRGLQRDLNRAVKYYQMGAHEGDPEGLYNLGVSLLRV